jgi:4'-phosphopantetheinyl transferase
MEEIGCRLESGVSRVELGVGSHETQLDGRTIVLGDARVLVLEINASSNELLQRFERKELYLDELEQRKSEHRKCEYLGARLALKELLGREVVVKYNEDGKPILQDGSHRISISHSGKWIAVMVHPSQEVGVDIECPHPKIEKVYTRFLGLQEQEELYGDGDRDIRKLQLAWSAKEALYKIIGKEAVDFAKQLRILPFEASLRGEMEAQHLPTQKDYNLFYIQQKEYTLVYCLE